MTAYIIQHVIIGFIILILVTMIVFLFVRLLPGDPLIVYMASFDISAQTIGEKQYNYFEGQPYIPKNPLLSISPEELSC